MYIDIQIDPTVFTTSLDDNRSFIYFNIPVRCFILQTCQFLKDVYPFRKAIFELLHGAVTSPWFLYETYGTLAYDISVACWLF